MTPGIAVFLLALIAALVVYVETRPADFRIERDAVIAAPAEAIYPLINGFHLWARWSPWEKLDPAMVKTFEGPASGPGSVYAWAGNAKAGRGRMTLRESDADRRVAITLEFLRPFKATNQTEFTLEPVDGGTRVTWAMRGRNNFPAKAFGLFINMDALVGKDFESGLANLGVAARAETMRLEPARPDAGVTLGA